MAEDLVVVSNRGPVSFRQAGDGTLVAQHGAGGLVSSLAPLVDGTGATWVAAAMTDADRQAATGGLTDADGFRLRLLAMDPDVYRMAYDVISNSTLWFLMHRMFDTPRRPRIDGHWYEAWEAYRAFNRSFAEAVMEDAPSGATVLVQDYHLALVGRWLAEERPDLRAVHFTHTPFCDPNDLRILPDAAVREVLSGMSAYQACGFHTARWAVAFRACCEEVLGRAPRTFVSTLAPDADSLTDLGHSPACIEAGRQLDEELGDRKVILRVDRMELSKNLIRGFLAYEDLLRRQPQWREQVVFLAHCYPSRAGLADYLAYRQEVEGVVARINAQLGTDGWKPILLDTEDDYPRSVAALQRYDVLLVNPIRDGLNLVAKEGPLVNQRHGVLALSREAGVWDELSGVALEINPFDVAGTSDVLGRALDMGTDARRGHATRLREVCGSRTPRDWLEDQLSAAADG